MRSRLGSMPTTQCSRKLSQPSAMSRQLCRKLWMISGLKTLSSKLPLMPPMLMATSLPITCAASMVTRLGLRGVDLARHDRAAGLVLGDGDLADAAARPRRQPAHVVGDLGERGRQRLERAVGVHQRVVAARASNLLGAVTKGRPVSSASSGRHAHRELGMRVEPGAHGGAAQRELAEVGQRRLDVLEAVVELRDVAGELLAQGQRRGVLQVGPADLDDVAEGFGLGVQRAPQAPHVRDDVAARRAWTAATLMAVGKTSFDDWPLFTSSLGCTRRPSPRSPPRISLARLASTSFMFMLLCVPLPVCQTTSGNSSS